MHANAPEHTQVSKALVHFQDDGLVLGSLPISGKSYEVRSLAAPRSTITCCIAIDDIPIYIQPGR